MNGLSPKTRVTLSITNLATILLASYAIITKTESRFDEQAHSLKRIEDRQAHTWSIEDQQNWSDIFRNENPAVKVPYTSDVLKRRLAIHKLNSERASIQ